MSVLHVDVPKFGSVLITHRCYELISRYRQIGKLPETGGSLVGYLRSDDVWIISRAMPPSSKSKAGRFWLQRDRGAAQKFIEAAFKESDGALNYVGEWHTHPEPTPSPSCKDFKMMSDILKNSRLETSFVFGLILGTMGNVCFWYQTKSERWVTMLKVPDYQICIRDPESIHSQA